jgi:hypothetical protein
MVVLPWNSMLRRMDVERYLDSRDAETICWAGNLSRSEPSKVPQNIWGRIECAVYNHVFERPIPPYRIRSQKVIPSQGELFMENATLLFCPVR